MRNRTYGGVRGRKTKVGRKLLRFPPTRLSLRQFTAKAKKFSAECNIHVFGESGNQVPAFAETCSSLLCAVKDYV